ncbi:MAG: CHASE2 domain-containing protein [Coleofasciculus sp. Co-bin14]|nr:CHASE2 domain-containing protein [Coleofasciculus sp. Co-bin14]
MELFELYLSPNDEPTRFKVIVAHSPTGEGEAESFLPFFDGENDWRTTLIKTLETIAFNPRDFQKAGEQDWMVKALLLTSERSAFHSNLLKTIGHSLYQALFPAGSEVERALLSALRLAESKNAQLHIQLRFAANSVKRSRLADYPWELMHDGQRFLSHHQVTFSRYIAYDSVPPNLPPFEQINVLLVSSAACDPDQGLQQLYQQEQQAVLHGLENAKQAGHIRLYKLERATFARLRAYLTEHPGTEAPHVLHFDGHGLFGKRCPNEECCTIHKGIKAERCRVCNTELPDSQGYLVFEDENGRPDYVSATRLGTLLQQTSFGDGSDQSRGVVLTVLSACQSGMAVIGDSVFNGTAQNLIGHRVPAVVAMQYSVSVQGAIQFAEQFYRSLGQKNSLAVAVNQGREAMGAEGNQWYRPILYLRWRDNKGGQLFAVSGETALPASPSNLLPSAVEVSKPPSLSPDSRLTGLIKRVRTTLLDGSSLKTMLAVSLIVTSMVSGLRFLGLLEWIELKAFDHLMQMRPISEGPDPRLLIVQITDEDILAQNKRQEKGDGTLRDPSLNRLLEKLERHQPRLIGLDLYRNFDADSSLPGLVARLGQERFFAVCKVPETDALDRQISPGIAPPKEVPPARVGFSDFVRDSDETVRRYLMAQEQVPGAPCRAEQSFSLLLARRYLELEPGQNSTYQDPFKSKKDLQIGGVVFTQLQPFTGGYQDVDASGYQVLLNYRSTGKGPENIAKRVTLEDVLNDRVPAEDVRDKIVLIGVTATQSIIDEWSTPYGTVSGVIVHAYMVSQILSAVMDEKRPLLRVWSQGVEFLWLWGWSVVGGVLAGYLRSPLWLGGVGGMAIVILYLTCLGFLTVSSLWVPLIPSTLALVLTSTGVYVVFRSRSNVAHLAAKS